MLEEVAKRDTAYEGQRIIKRVRTDNDKVIRGKPWVEALATREVEAMHSTPYTPQQNCVVERMMRTVSDCLRAILAGVDKTMWDYAAEYFAYTWNKVPRRNYARLPRAKNIAPADIRIHMRKKRKHDTPHVGPKVDTLETRGVESAEINFEPDEDPHDVNNENADGEKEIIDSFLANGAQ